jgi:hypothetical protein
MQEEDNAEIVQLNNGGLARWHQDLTKITVKKKGYSYPCNRL